MAAPLFKVYNGVRVMPFVLFYNRDVYLIKLIWLGTQCIMNGWWVTKQQECLTVCCGQLNLSWWNRNKTTNQTKNPQTNGSISHSPWKLKHTLQKITHWVYFLSSLSKDTEILPKASSKFGTFAQVANLLLIIFLIRETCIFHWLVHN